MASKSIINKAFFIIAMLAAPIARAKEGDWSLRQELNARIKLTDRHTVLSRTALFLHEDMSELLAVFSGLNVGYNLFPSLRLEAGYRHV